MKPSDLPRAPWTPQGDASAPAHTPGAWAPQQLAVQFMASVTEPGPQAGQWWVDAGGHRLLCAAAVSLLAQPAPGDRVLCCQALSSAGGDHQAPGEGEGAGQAFLLAVLARAADGPALRVAIGPAATLHAQDDGLHIEAAHLRATTQRAHLQANEVTVVARACHAVAETWGATVQQMRLIGGLFTSVFEREVLHAGQHSRTVEGLARTQAPVIEHDASTVLHLRGQQVLTNGERLVKTQGAQIHLG